MKMNARVCPQGELEGRIKGLTDVYTHVVQTFDRAKVLGDGFADHRHRAKQSGFANQSVEQRLVDLDELQDYQYSESNADTSDLHRGRHRRSCWIHCLQEQAPC